MIRATPIMRDLAQRLIRYENRANGSPGTNSPFSFPVCAKLRPHLVTLVGSAGYQALVSRALVLAKTEAAWLGTVRVKIDGSLEASEEVLATAGSADILEGRIVLLAQLLGLLVAFIGANLAVRLVSEIWPKVPLDDLDLGRRRK
jgi:hypothetical protein